MIEAISSLSPSLTTSIEGGSLTNTGQTESFSDLLVSKVNDIDATVKMADASIKKYALGESVPTHELMLQLETAKYELQMAVEVRNKLVEAYQELLRMQL